MTEQLKVIISAEISNFKKNIDNAKKTIKDFATKGIKDIEKFKQDLQTVGDGAKKALGIMAGATVAAATALMALGESTKEYRQQQAQLKTAFESAGGSAETAKQTYNDLYRVLGDSGKATEAAQHLAKLTTNEKELAEWTKISTGVYATFGESLPLESLTEAVNHSAKLGEVQGTLADALEWSGISVDEFNEQLFWCNTESEREKLIRDTLNGIYSDAAAGYETNNAAILAQNEAQAKLTDAMAQLGEVTAPIMTMLYELGADILAQLMPYIEDFAANHLPAVKEALSGVGDAIGKVISWIVDNWSWIAPIAAVVTAIAAAIAIASTALTVYNTVMAITSVVSAPVIIILAAIAAAIALLIIYWDEVAAFAKKAWEVIKNAWNSVATWFNETVIQPLVNFFTNLWSKITEIATNIKNGVVNAFNSVKNAISNVVSGIWNAITGTFNKITSAMSKPIEKARDLIKGIIDKIKGFFKFEWSLPKLKVPKFAITPSGWQIGDLLKGVIPKLGITWNARGGVFDKPTLFNYGDSLQGLGENGAEAVVPLENNLEWLNKLADMLAQRMQPTPVVLQIDGKTFAQTTVKSINNLTRQTGKLGLNLV